MPNDTKHVLLNCPITATTRNKFLGAICRKENNSRNLDDGSVVRYILNFNAENISVVNMLCSEKQSGLTDAIGYQ